MKARQRNAAGKARQPALKRQQVRPTVRPYPTRTQLEAINAERMARGITLEEISEDAKRTAKTGTCSVPTVSRVFSGDTKSWNVLDAYDRVKKAREAAA